MKLIKGFEVNIATNNSVLNTSENMFNNKKKLDGNIEKLATGLKVNKASDNASSLAIADKLRTQVTSIGQSVENAMSGVILTQIADKAIGEQSTILDVIKEKLIQANTSTTSDEGRKNITKDIVKLMGQLDDIASTTNYNGTYLLQQDRNDQSASRELEFQVGELSSNTIDLENALVQANSVGYDLVDLKDADTTNGITREFAASQMEKIDEAISTANSFRSNFAAIHNQLKSATRTLNVSLVNMSGAESVIRDLDYASESAEFTKNNIINQSGSFAMSQSKEAHNKAMDLVA